MQPVLHKLALRYCECCEDLRAAREIGKVAHRLIAQHLKRTGACLPSWHLRGELSSEEGTNSATSPGLYRYFANTIMQVQRQRKDMVHQPLPPWLRSALQGKPSQSCTDADVDSALNATTNITSFSSVSTLKSAQTCH